MIINSYLIDEKACFSDNLTSNYVSIDIRLDCLPIDYLNKIENVFKNYQITLKHTLNFSYVKVLLMINQRLIWLQNN